MPHISITESGKNHWRMDITQSCQVLQAANIASAAFAQKLLGLRSTTGFWSHIKRTTGKAKKPRLAIPANDVVDHFKKLLAPPNCSLFDDEYLKYAEAVLRDFEPGPPVKCLNDPISSEEIKDAIKRMKNSAPGEDGIGKNELSKLDPEDIATFFLHITESIQVPSSWTRSILVPIPKPGKPAITPRNLRGISLQQALRKLFVSCVVPRLYSWTESKNLLQYYQIGFRPGYRTTDNIFILRVAHERAFAEGRTLLIEVLKELYRQPSTAVHFNGTFSDFFDVVMGVLQGDPLSPLLFIIFLSALDVAIEASDDPTVNGVRVPALMLADDITLLSLTYIGMQRKLRILQDFCHKWRLIIHAKIKTKAMLLGQPSTEAPLYLCDEVLEYTNEHSVNGFIVHSGGQWDSKAHLLNRIASARSVAHSLMALRTKMHMATSVQWLRLYKALVEPNLIFASEASFDCTADLHNQMAAIQMQFGRFILGLHSRSMKGLVLADLGILPIRLRRLQLTARHYWYTRAHPSHLAYAAVEDSKKLALSTSNRAAKFRGWYFQFTKALAQFGFGNDLNIETQTFPFDLMSRLISHTDTESIVSTSRLSIFSGTSIHTVQQPYLLLPRALGLYVASLRSSTHFLNIERLRRQRPFTERDSRFCPLCPTAVGDERHALFHCPDHKHAREEFIRKVHSLPGSKWYRLSETERLQYICTPSKDKTTCLTIASFIQNVLKKLRNRYMGRLRTGDIDLTSIMRDV